MTKCIDTTDIEQRTKKEKEGVGDFVVVSCVVVRR